MLHVLVATAGVLLIGWASAGNAAPCGGFTDVDDTNPATAPFCASVAWMKNRGITLGCASPPNPPSYCPNQNVTRLQMAAFMYRLGYENAFLQGGNTFNEPAVLGTTDWQPIDIQAFGRRVMRYELVLTDQGPNLIGGDATNSVAPNVYGATIGGGGRAGDFGCQDIVGNDNPCANLVTDGYGTVGGGMANRAGDHFTPNAELFATVGGGYQNDAFGYASTIAGGDTNIAGAFAAVGGGINNRAFGAYSVVPGGASNLAVGQHSFAAGKSARADRAGCFVFSNWSSGSGSCLGSERVARFILDHGLFVDYYQPRADGGGMRWVYFGDLLAGSTISTWTGAHLTDSGVWTNASDRSLKDGFAEIDVSAVLDGVIRLPISRWHYRTDGPLIQHIGPTAQDFRSAFALGASDKAIGTVDADGIALAAIQGLNAKLEAERAAKDAEIAALRAELAEIRTLLAGRSVGADVATH